MVPIRNIGTAAMPVMRSVAQHEFAHSFRHQLDGDKGHFAADSARFWYLRSHSGTSCAPTNHGFALNEGWAEHWADEVRSTPARTPRTSASSATWRSSSSAWSRRVSASPAGGWSRYSPRTGAGSTRCPTSATRSGASRAR